MRLTGFSFMFASKIMKQKWDLNHAHRLVILLFIVSLSVSADENTEQLVPCKKGWYFFGDKCYQLIPLSLRAGLSFGGSIASCRMNGGYLASIHSNELQEFLTAFLLLNAKSHAWIGLHDREAELEFSWVDGSIYNYSNWDDKEPSRVVNFNEEDCVEMRYDHYKKGIGTWNDEACSTLRPHICQVNKSYDTKSPDPRFCTMEEGGGWKYLNSCYHIVNEEKTWEDAEKYCEEKYKGYLVSLLDNNTEVFVNYIKKISNLSKNIWIGIKMENKSMQRWASGWHVANKNYDQERLPFVNETCALTSNRNSWETNFCLRKYSFICEKIKYNVPVLKRPPSDDWKCPIASKKWLDLGGDSCYYIENNLPRNWLEANYECGKIGSTLASIHSENETNILHPHVIGTQQRLFIGLRRNSTKSTQKWWLVGQGRNSTRFVFEWADGTEVVYENWDKGEPNNIFEVCGELWTSDMTWNDVNCNEVKGYICKAKKVFSSSKLKEISDQVPCSSALSTAQIYSSGIPTGTTVGTVFCTFVLGLIVGVIVYHYHDYLKRYCTKFENEDFTSTAPSSLGHVSEKVIWKPEELNC